MPPGSPTRAPPGTGFGVRSHVDALVREALTDAIEGGLFRVRTVPAYAVHEPADPAFGDLTCDVAMVLARQTGRSPYAIAGAIAAAGSTVWRSAVPASSTSASGPASGSCCSRRPWRPARFSGAVPW